MRVSISNWSVAENYDALASRFMTSRGGPCTLWSVMSHH